MYISLHANDGNKEDKIATVINKETGSMNNLVTTIPAMKILQQIIFHMSLPQSIRDQLPLPPLSTKKMLPQT